MATLRRYLRQRQWCSLGSVESSRLPGLLILQRASLILFLTRGSAGGRYVLLVSMLSPSSLGSSEQRASQPASPILFPQVQEAAWVCRPHDPAGSAVWPRLPDKGSTGVLENARSGRVPWAMVHHRRGAVPAGSGKCASRQAVASDPTTPEGESRGHGCAGGRLTSR